MTMRSAAVKNFLKEKIFGCKVLVIGDVMLDKYYFGEVKRISPEAPVPITRVLSQKETLGGAANVAHNLARLGCQTFLAGMTGRDEHRASLERELNARGIAFSALICTERPTTAKVRIMGDHQQMLRLDFEEKSPPDRQTQEQLLEAAKMLLQQQIDFVILSDYAKGLCTQQVCQTVISLCNELRIPIAVDPKGKEWGKYAGATYITPNLKELNEVLLNPVANENEAVQAAARKIRQKYKVKNVVVTRSECGLSLIKARQAVHVPTVAQEVFDVSGAGDTVIAVLGAAIGGGMASGQAAELANLAAGIVVGKLGTYAVSREELLMALDKRGQQKWSK